ncbi:MAG: DUF1232 domain-containing protein [Rhodocyclaceae bacterium]|nr:DUF1232 domain-containing protein [Rhodocyclaceae bacterium]MBK6907029.1 DUF1232 domain-containing protein [Rhodocyclaceae bacterium]
MGWFDSLKQRAGALKAESLALLLAARDPRTPLLAKLLIVVVVAYALSPIDLIPDFIPVLGYLDDLLLVPLGLMLAIRLVPPEVLSECRLRAGEMVGRAKRFGSIAAAVIALFWLAVALWLYAWWTAG